MNSIASNMSEALKDMGEDGARGRSAAPGRYQLAAMMGSLDNPTMAAYQSDNAPLL